MKHAHLRQYGFGAEGMVNVMDSRSLTSKQFKRLSVVLHPDKNNSCAQNQEWAEAAMKLLSARNSSINKWLDTKVQLFDDPLYHEEKKMRSAPVRSKRVEDPYIVNEDWFERQFNEVDDSIGAAKLFKFYKNTFQLYSAVASPKNKARWLQLIETLYDLVKDKYRV